MINDEFGELLTVRQVSEILSVSERSIREFISTGELRATKIGQWRIPKDAVREFFGKRSNVFARDFQKEIDEFLQLGNRTDAGPFTMLIRDYQTGARVDLGAVEERVSSIAPEGSSFRWRYMHMEEKQMSRHVFYGDLDRIREIVSVLDLLYGR